MSNEDIERRAQQAALEGAIAGIRKELPNYRIMVLGKDCEKRRGAAIGHPTAMDGEVYIWVKIL